MYFNLARVAKEFGLGMGLGFLYDNLVAGMFIGLGAGFVLFALTMVFKK